MTNDRMKQFTSTKDLDKLYEKLKYSFTEKQMQVIREMLKNYSFEDWNDTDLHGITNAELDDLKEKIWG